MGYVMHPMTREEFKRRGSAVLGGVGWMSRFMRGTGVGYQSVRRWVHGQTPVPPMAASIVVLLEILAEHELPFPPEFGYSPPTSSKS